MMAFCNVHCLRKSSRIIVIPTTSINVLWDAIVSLSSTPTLNDRPFAKLRNSLSFGTHRWCLLTSNNKPHISVHPKEDFSFGKGVSIFMSFFFFLYLYGIFQFNRIIFIAVLFYTLCIL